MRKWAVEAGDSDQTTSNENRCKRADYCDIAPLADVSVGICGNGSAAEVVDELLLVAVL